jgi:hypothetical protein
MIMDPMQMRDVERLADLVAPTVMRTITRKRGDHAGMSETADFRGPSLLTNTVFQRSLYTLCLCYKKYILEKISVLCYPFIL